MSLPPLRQPKKVKTLCEGVEKYVILTLKDGGKLVVSSDGFNGVVTMGVGYKCVLCCVDIQSDYSNKEKHKELLSHKKILERYPHIEEFGRSLIRQLNKDTCYCTICSVTMSAHMLMLHIASESHTEELERASTRAGSYHPSDLNNNK